MSNIFTTRLASIKATQNTTDESNLSVKDCRQLFSNYLQEKGLPVSESYSADKSNFYRPFVNYLFFENKLEATLDAVVDFYHLYGEEIAYAGYPAYLLKCFDAQFLQEQQTKSLRQDAYGDEAFYLLDILQNVVGNHGAVSYLYNAYIRQEERKEQIQTAKANSEKARADFMNAYRLTQAVSKSKTTAKKSKKK